MKGVRMEEGVWKAFLTEMEELLGEGYPAYLECEHREDLAPTARRASGKELGNVSGAEGGGVPGKRATKRRGP